MLQTAIAGLRTILPKPTRFTLLVTPFPGPPGWACTLTIDRITDTVVRAVASFRTILSVVVRITWTIAPYSLPSGSAETLAALRCTRSSIHAFTFLTAILTVGSITALLLAVFSSVTGDTVTSSVDMITRRVILAGAVNRTIPTISQEWAWPITERTTPTWIAVTLSGPWMAHLGVIYNALALSRAVLSEPVIRTYPQPTVGAHPTGRTRALAGSRVAHGPVQTPACLRTVVAISVVRA